MSYLTYLLTGWVFMNKIWPGRRGHWVKYKNNNNSDLDGMSLASFCQSRAALVNDGKCYESVGPCINFQLTVYYNCTVVWKKFTSNVLNISRVASWNILDIFHGSRYQKIKLTLSHICISVLVLYQHDDLFGDFVIHVLGMFYCVRHI